MVVEWIIDNLGILSFIALVLAILLFKIASSLTEDRRKAAQAKREQRWRKTFDRCRAAGSFRLTDRETARFSLSGMLIAFDALNKTDDADACAAVLRENSEAIVRRVSGRADGTEKGYFAYILSTADLASLPDDVRARYAAFMLKLLGADSVFCRENALKALYHLGDAGAVAAAIETLSADARLHNEKLLADGMNSFRGDQRQLAAAMMERFDRYDDHSQSAVITFFTLADFHDWDERFKARLEDPAVSLDQRCDILRLLLKAPSPETKTLLVDTLRRKGHEPDWQTAAVAATGLAAYPDDAEVIEALQSGVTSPAWSVRMNCAAALVRLAPPQEIIDGILNGGDAFAADAMRFALHTNGSEDGI